MIIKTQRHTIFLMVGPSNCGKSTFVNGISSQLTNYNIQVISSDQIRRELIGRDLHKHDNEMLYASDGAFDLLFKKLDIVTTYPINADFVFVDTTGLSKVFRDQVLEIAKKNHYNVDCVLFDFKDRNDYYKFLDEKTSKFVISKHVKRLKQETLKEIRSKDFKNIHKIKEHYETFTFDFIDDDYKLSNDKEYLIVGDIHECIDEFKILLEETEFNKFEDNKRIIIIGDYIDKGSKLKETIDYLYKNQNHMIFILGNHENYVYKRLKDKIKENEELEKTYFTSIKIFENDEGLRNKFFELVEMSIPFATHKNYIITHAPCKKKYLGKLDNHSLRSQRNFSFNENTRKTNNFDEDLAFLKEEAVSNHPYHIFGHVALKNFFRYKNKIGIDTGCINRNKLTGVIINEYGKPFVKSVKFQNKQELLDEKELPILFRRESDSIDFNFENIDHKDRKFIDRLSRDKVQFLSGTMCPADKDIEAGELESLKKGLDYYKDKGIQRVVLQPKYMGSRAQVYLNKDIEKCYSISRNGYKIKHVNMTPIFEKLIKRFTRNFDEFEWIVLDGELMPWAALGEGLINRQFKLVDEAIRSELDFLERNGFDSQISTLNESYIYSDFSKDRNEISKNELIKKYGDHKYQNFKYIDTINKFYTPVYELKEKHKIYHEQIELYGSSGELDYKPFSFLKVILPHNSGINSSLKSNIEMSEELLDDYFVIDFSKENYYDEAQTFFNKITCFNNMEGIVIKPEFSSYDYAPYIKVRNPRYLTIIYGYDYTIPFKYDKLMKQKNIKRKLSTSIKEFNIGKEMLDIKIDEIENSKKYRNLCAIMTVEFKKEKELDPRL